MLQHRLPPSLGMQAGGGFGLLSVVMGQGFNDEQVLLLALLLPALPIFVPPALRAERAVVRKSGEKMEKTARLIEKRADAQGLTATKRAAQNMQKLGQKMAQGRMDKKQAMVQMSQLSKQMADEQRRLAQANSGAGQGSGFSDEQYERAGAQIVDDVPSLWDSSEMIVKVKEPLRDEYPLMRKGQIIFTYFHFAADRELTDAVRNSGAVAIAYETVQEANRSLPLLVPMSEVAGRMAVQEAAKYLEKTFGATATLTPPQSRPYGFVLRNFGNAKGGAGFVLYRLTGKRIALWLVAVAGGEASWAKPLAGAVALSIHCAAPGAPASLPRDKGLLAARISLRCIKGQCDETDFAATYLTTLRVGYVHNTKGDVFLVKPRRDYWQNGAEGPGFYHQIGGENEKLEPGRTN